MTVDKVSQIVKETIKSYMYLEQYFKLDYQGCSDILGTGNISFLHYAICQEKFFRSSRGKRSCL